MRDRCVARQKLHCTPCNCSWRCLTRCVLCRRQQQSLTNLLFERQFAPCSKRTCSQSTSEQSTRCIDSWAEGDSLKRCSATYCQLTPPPRSTIAAAFSPDGKLVASTQYVDNLLRTLQTTRLSKHFFGPMLNACFGVVFATFELLLAVGTIQ